MKKFLFTNPEVDSICLSPELYGKLARLFSTYTEFWPCKKLISDRMEGASKPVSEERIEENIIHFFTDIFMSLHRLENKDLTGLEWTSAHQQITDVFHRTEINQSAVSSFNVMQILQHILFTHIELSYAHAIESDGGEESSELRFLRRELFTSVCLATLNNLVPEYRDAPWETVLGANLNTT